MYALSVFDPGQDLRTIKTEYRVSMPTQQKTVVNVKKIILLENGSVREEGTFDELLKRDSLFSEFVHRQSLL